MNRIEGALLATPNGTAVLFVCMGLFWSLFAAHLGSSADPRFPAWLMQQTITCDRGNGPEPEPLLGAFEQQWFSGELHGAREEPIFDQPRATTVAATYRFSWFASFFGNVVVRVEETDAGAVATMTRSGSMRLDQRLSRRLSDVEYARVRTAFERVRQAPTRTCLWGVDGAVWIAEGRDARGYIYRQRWSPQTGATRDFGVEMARLTGWELDPLYATFEWPPDLPRE